MCHNKFYRFKTTNNGGNMILMISSDGKTLKSQPNPRFGRAETFIKYDLQDDSWVALDNPAVSQAGGAGVAASQFLANQNATTAISGHFGPNAYRALSAAGVKMLTFNNSYKTIEEVIQAFKRNELEEV
jgi:predicted Fe-Mo cluster-binding NifX family protein